MVWVMYIITAGMCLLKVNYHPRGVVIHLIMLALRNQISGKKVFHHVQFRYFFFNPDLGFLL